MSLLRRRLVSMSHMRYRFVDCRWSLDDPAAPAGGRTSRATSPARRSSTSSATSRRRPARAGAIRCRATTQFAAAASRAGIDAGTFVVAYGSLGGAERLWWLLRHFGHDACAVIDLAAGSGRSSRRRGGAGAGGVRAADRAPTTRSTPDELPHGDSASSSSSTRACRPASAASRTRSTVCPGRIPGALNAPWNEPLPELPAGRARRLLRLGGDRVRAAPPAAPRRPRRTALPRLVVGVGAAPGAARGTGLEIDRPRRRPSRPRASPSHRARGSAPSAAGSSASRAG